MANRLGISSKIPSLLAYPVVLPFKDVPELKGMFVYVLEAYPLQGLSAVITRFRDEDGVPLVTWRLGDWDGHTIDMNKEHPQKNLAKKFMLEHSEKLLGMMQKAGIYQAQFYMSHMNGELVLTDIRASLNKMLGPGFTEQLGSGAIKVQKQLMKPLILDDDTLTKISKKIRPFNTDIIFKPSAFKTIVRGKDLQPMYGLLT